ncbi:hypothetical protein PUNSTDRAFT_55578 [Punctularia strigosozonata HHB-11173 SS5]|uniref:HAD-like protein n=1 Tax=Punctularia strigosozonata (strain HHB-11173) TaxID=741275 RepID=R7S4S5_PUNST|nr:uncharacterized protein PUNSTDRAFT_55578 [Punctularia strigosozonata HHB-11173 SS5]EIN04251.1 hypothetical protein PUNSTDRAFT_55578 [Punctularia strigosozonata HHB-11173 SS5]
MPMVSRPAIRAVLIDLSGTLHIGTSALPGAVAALQRLREARVPFRFCSNTSKESTADLVRKLRAMGFGVKSKVVVGPEGKEGGEEEVWTSLGAVKRMIEARGLHRPYFLLSPSAAEECSANLPSSDPNTPYDAVVVGLAPAMFTYDNLTTAFRVLIGEEGQPSSASASASASTSTSKPNIAFLATHKAKYVRTPDKQLSLGPGPFVAALEDASGAKAEVVGKSTKAFFESVIGSMNLDGGDAGRIAVIGDDVAADLGEGALELGLWRVLVKTGKYRPGDETREDAVPPDEVQDSFASWVDSLLLDREAHSRL